MKKKTKIIIASAIAGIVLLAAAVIAFPYIVLMTSWYAYPEYAYDKSDGFEELIDSYELVKDTLLEYEKSGQATQENSLYYINIDHNIYEAFDENKTPLLPEGTEITLSNEKITVFGDVCVFNGSVAFGCGELTGCEIVYSENIRKYLNDTDKEDFRYNKLARNWYSVFV